MLLMENNSIYESHMGYPVYYHNGNINGYQPPTPPPYSSSTSSGQWETKSGFTSKSEIEDFSSSSPVGYQHLVYPQFPTPPLSVSPATSPVPMKQQQSRSGESFQIKRLLNLEDPTAVDYYPEDHQNHSQRNVNILSMRTSSVIMKIEDQRVFQVDSTTTALPGDEDSSFDHAIHQQYPQQYSSPELKATATENLFICKWEKCYKVFCHLTDLAGHVTTAHGSAPMGSANYYCKWEGCPRTDRGFNARYKMLVHIRTHTKEKPHQCPECNKCFSRAENLKIHIRSHSGEKPYVCPVAGCNKAYSNSSDRFKHTRTHSMTKPYQCKVAGCNKRYTDPSSLRKHVKTYKHKISGQEEQFLVDEESLMQERITSTSDDIDEKSSHVDSYYHKAVQSPPSCSSVIDQQMTDLDIHERSPCYCRHELGVQGTVDSSSYEERLKMYRLGAIFNVNPAHCDVLVSSSRPEGNYFSSYRQSMELETPLDLSCRQK